MPPPYTEAEAQVYAKRVGVRIETARSVLSFESQSRERAAATRAAACSEAAARILRLHASATGADARTDAVTPVPSAPAATPSPPARIRKLAGLPSTSPQQAAAARMVALHIRSLGENDA